MSKVSLFKLLGMKVLIGVIGFIISIASAVMLAIYYYPGSVSGKGNDTNENER